MTRSSVVFVSWRAPLGRWFVGLHLTLCSPRWFEFLRANISRSVRKLLLLVPHSWTRLLRFGPEWWVGYGLRPRPDIPGQVLANDSGCGRASRCREAASSFVTAGVRKSAC